MIKTKNHHAPGWLACLLRAILVMLMLAGTGKSLASNNEGTKPDNGSHSRRSGLPMNPGDDDGNQDSSKPGSKNAGKKDGNKKDDPGKGKNASGKVRVIRRSILKMPNLRGQRVRFVSKKIRMLEVYGE